jgi:hypothetical protein
MTASRLRFVLAFIGLFTGLASLIVLATEFAATVGDLSSRSSDPSGAFVASLALINPTYARQQGFAAASRSKLQSGSEPPRVEAEQMQAMISALLALSPTDAELWMMQGRLAASLQATDQRIAEMLKMSYLTAPGNFTLMPSRLEIAMTSRALSDPVLEVLAEGDVRALLRMRADLSDKLVESYHRATESGKAFLVRAAASDPRFVERLAASRRLN